MTFSVVVNRKRGDNKEQSLGQALKEGCEQLDSASRGVNDWVQSSPFPRQTKGRRRLAEETAVEEWATQAYNRWQLGVEEKIVVLRLLSQFLSKALFFIYSRARVANLNCALSRRKSFNKTGKLLKWKTSRSELCSRCPWKKEILAKTPKYPINSNESFFFMRNPNNSGP